MTEIEFLKELEARIEMRVMKDAIPSYFGINDGEKVILRVVNPKNPDQIRAATKRWNIKLATVLREKFEDLWREAKPSELS